MNNNIIKINKCEENEHTLVQDYFNFQDLIVTGSRFVKEKEFIKEYNEVDENGDIIKADNRGQELYKRHMEIFVRRQQHEEICPHCGNETNRIHDYRTRSIQIPNIFGEKAVLRYKTTRYLCVKCNCRFNEECRDICARQRKHNDVAQKIMEDLGEIRNVESIANAENVGKKYVYDVIDAIPEKNQKLGEYLCIDEFKGDMIDPRTGEKNKYQTVIVNPKEGELIDVLPTRDKNTLDKYFNTISMEERKKVKYVICDMCPTFMNLPKKWFPNAITIIDKFHYTSYVVNAFDRVRKDEQNRYWKENKKGLKAYRKLIMKHEKELKEGERARVVEILEKSPILRKSYELLQEFYEFNESKERAVAKMKLHKFYEHVEASNEKAFIEVIKTLKRKEEGILNSFLIEYTNSYSEGTNNLTKTLKRVSFGLKNLTRFKKRLSHIMRCNKIRKEAKKAKRALKEKCIREMNYEKIKKAA